MKHFFIISVLIILGVSFSISQKMVRLVLAGRTDFNLQEVGTVFHQTNDTIRVSQTFNGNVRAAENKDVDFQEGDVLVVANGTRVKSIKDLRKIYDDTKKNDILKLGIKRNGQSMIVDVHKVEAKPDPNQKMTTMTFDTDDMKLLPGIGFIEESGKTIKLKDMPPDPEVAKVCPLKIGDQFKTINGKSITSFKQFKSLYKKVKVGDKVSLTIIRGGEEQTVSVTKPESRVMIKN